MTEADRAQMHEDAVLLSRFFANLHHACVAIATDLVTWIQDGRELQDHFARTGSGTYARHLAPLIDTAEGIRRAFELLEKTTVQTQAHLEDLVMLAGIDTGEPR